MCTAACTAQVSVLLAAMLDHMALMQLASCSILYVLTLCLHAAGDLARWLPDGTIDFMGRLDNQARRRL